MALPVACPFFTLRVPDVRSDLEVGSLRTNDAKSLTGRGLHHPPPLYLCNTSGSELLEPADFRLDIVRFDVYVHTTGMCHSLNEHVDFSGRSG